ncbi:MAG TPA: flagellar protein FlaG [Syntrophomonadaceae bacterium]|nr:flagellar protein FlaG [Syntrophomonadaceae bacterium]
MRVEGQNMVVDQFPVKGKADRTVGGKASPKGNEKIGLKDLKVEEKHTPETLQKAVDTANKAMEISNYHLQFRLHEESGRYQVKVIDSLTDKVIREIPPKVMLEFSATIKKMLNDAVGILVDEVI